MKPTIGIIGGSGPLATVDIEKKILLLTQQISGVLTDQDYYNIISLNYCSTHDRNDSVYFGKSDPLTQYLNYVSIISALKVDLILLACNTAHMYISALRRKTNIPIISILESTLSHFKSYCPNASKVGLISTRATKEKKLYHSLFNANDIEVVDVCANTQDSVMEAIYLIKAGVELNRDEPFFENTLNKGNSLAGFSIQDHQYKKVLTQQILPNPKVIVENAIIELKKKGCKHIIFGCTELPLLGPYISNEHGVRTLDSNEIVASKTIEYLMKIENNIQLNKKNDLQLMG